MIQIKTLIDRVRRQTGAEYASVRISRWYASDEEKKYHEHYVKAIIGAHSHTIHTYDEPTLDDVIFAITEAYKRFGADAKSIKMLTEELQDGI
jgi:hypothetical protein